MQIFNEFICWPWFFIIVILSTVQTFAEFLELHFWEQYNLQFDSISEALLTGIHTSTCFVHVNLYLKLYSFSLQIKFVFN